MTCASTELVRGLLDHVVLCPGERGPEVELVGELAGMVALALPTDANGAREGVAAAAAFRRSMKVVAGAENRRQFLMSTRVWSTTFRVSFLEPFSHLGLAGQ